MPVGMTEYGRFGPLPEDHPLVGKACPACCERIQAGHSPTLVTIGPGGDEEARRLHTQGRPYNAITIVCHQACVHGYGNPEWGAGSGN